MVELLNAKELAARLGVSGNKFHDLRRRGLLRMFEVSRPLGRRKYARVLVERYLAGESMSTFGERRRA